MAVYSVTYDLIKSKDYSRIIEGIKKFLVIIGRNQLDHNGSSHQPKHLNKLGIFLKTILILMMFYL